MYQKIKEKCFLEVNSCCYIIILQSFDFAYKNYLDKADWYLKADDDTYAIVENLRYMLKDHDTNEPVFFGHHFKVSRRLVCLFRHGNLLEQASAVNTSINKTYQTEI